jgi:hypothetical protein
MRCIRIVDGPRGARAEVLMDLRVMADLPLCLCATNNSLANASAGPTSRLGRARRGVRHEPLNA